MTDDEMRTCVAERVMGWHKETRAVGIRISVTEADYDWWVSEKGDKKCMVRNWHPETDLMQAMMVVGAISNHLFSVRLRFINALRKQVREAGNVDAFWWFMFMADKPRAIFMADKPRAIFMAAAQVAEAMEDEKE